MNMLAITVGLFTAICILKRVTAQDIRSTCPATGFTDRLPSNVSCTVDTNFYGSCLPVPTLVTFFFSKGGSTTPWCSTSYTACETTGQTQTACNGCSCNCSDENPTTNINKYSLTFIPNLNYDGGSFYCEIACVIPSRPETTNHSSCANAKVGEDPNSNVGQAPEKEGGIGGADLKRNEGLSPEEKGGIGGGVAVVVIVTIVAIGSGVVIKTKIYVFFFFPEDQDGLTNYETLQKEIAKMWGVGIGEITPEDKKKYKDANYVIYISKLSGDQQKKSTEVKDFIEGLGGRLNCGAA